MKLRTAEDIGMGDAVANEAPRFYEWAVGPRLRNVRRAMLPPLRATYRTPRPVVPVRQDLPYLLNARGLVGSGAEVGVRDGEFSEIILDRWRGKRFVSIDAWREFDIDDYVDRSNVAQQEHDNNLATTERRLERFGDRSTILKAASVEAAETIAPASLDFVYLDARHDFDGVMEDLEAWIPKLRPGAVAAGHDYVDGLFTDGDFGVKSAVDSFFGRRGWRVQATWGDPPWVSWYVIIPR